MRTTRAAAAPLLLAAALLVPGVAPAAAVGAADRAEVQSGFLDEVLPALETPIDWTGDAATCRAGAPSAAAQSATLTTINFVRRLAGLDPVSFDPALSAKAQEAALMMHANDDLEHEPPQSWRCWTQEGAEAAGSSNIALGAGGAEAILLYMEDSGGGNTAVGHRRWILRPDAGTMGSGSTSGANALWVFGADAPEAAKPQWIPWPVAGYFPSPLEPAGRWSLSASDDSVSFAGATVRVTGPDGTALPVETYPPETGFGPNSLVWEVRGVTIPTGDDPVTYGVVVSGITAPSGSVTYGYDVHLFSPPLSVVTGPAVLGRPRVGKTLRAEPGEWTPEPASFDYRWLRAGSPIAGADGALYRLTRADRGKTVAVEVTAQRFAFAHGVATSASTRKVAPRI